MKLSHLFRIAAFKAACALLFAQGVNAEPLANAPGFVHDTVQVPAPSLGDNLFEESDTQTLHVYLPPSYESDQDARFPVLYFFAGYWMGEDIHYVGYTLPQIMKEREFIIVSVKDNNRLRGTFAANSAAIGNWHDFYIKDVVPWVDAHYRTIAKREARAVGGISMGGHIALRLGFEHPDVFGAMYAQCPGVFDENGLENAWPTWDQDFFNAYGSAYAPNPDKPFPHADIPTMDGSPEDLAIRARWKQGFGNIPERLDAYLAGNARLDAIWVEVGTNDEYPWIPQGCVYLSRQLFERRIPHSFVLTTDRHTFGPEIFRKGMGPAVAGYFAR